jgi:hypothetical protein
VLAGDTKQLSSVDAGGGFRGLVARLGAHRLLENRRQVERWERDAMRDLREGRAGPAMTAYAEHDRLHPGDREELLARMVDDWWSARDRGESVMQAASWRDVTELNARARERLAAAGLVDREGLDVRFAGSWRSPLTERDGCGEDELAAAERRLGLRLPAAVREAYALFGKWPDLTSNQDGHVDLERSQPRRARGPTTGSLRSCAPW